MTIREELFEWLSDRPEWQQDLARRLTSSPQLDGEAFDDALAMVLNAFDALVDREPPAPPQILEIDDMPGSSAAAGQSPRLVRFGHLRGLGMASADQQLQFSETGLTVVYGPNAAGKTTYVRGLKRVCRTVDRDAAVRGNVFVAPEVGAPPPSANVEYRVGGDLRAQQIDLATPPDLGLGDISVFDARCAEFYVDSRNTIAYVPSALLVLARLAATQDQMRSRISAEIAQLEGTRPLFPELEQASGAKDRVEQIRSSSDLEELASFATLVEQEVARQQELRAIIAAAETRSARADAQAARQDSTETEVLAGRLKDLASRVTGPAVAALRACAVEDKRTREATELAAKEFNGLPVPGVGGEAWQRLWRAARQFNEAVEATFPPTAGEHCPLCQQELGGEAAARMAHFEQHVRSSIQAEAEAARAAMAAALERLQDSHLEACRTPLLVGLKEREPELYQTLESYLTDIGAQMRALREDPSTDALPILDEPVGKLESWGHARGTHAATLLAAEDPKRETELRRELRELDAREKLSLRLDEIATWVRALGRIDALSRAYAGLATNRLTSRQRELSDGLVTATLGGRLTEELRHLGCEHLPVDLQPQTAVGETHVVLQLAGAHGAPTVSEILSEGEQRAVSLAFFLAEVGGSEHDGGVIVDDPVSSLDDERRAYIAKRLVEESARRQVVVLTHDLPFLLDLSDHAEAAGDEPMIQGIWRLGDEVGRVDDHPPFTAMKLKQRVGALDQKIAQWDKQPEPRDFDEAWRRVCDVYDEMRKTWERAIEERLFRGVVQRLQREVKTLKLKDVEITPEQIAIVTDGMTRCSYFVHDSPPAVGTNLPGRQQLAQDLEKLRNFERDTRA